jgi:hypothetical protein
MNNMKQFRLVAIIASFLFVLSGLQTGLVSAAPISVCSTTLLDQWGNENTFVFRGYPSSVTLVLFSSTESYPAQIFITLMDRDNVAVAVANQAIVFAENTVLTINLHVGSHAFVGEGRYIIVVTNQNLQPFAALSVPIYISILGDFDLDGKVAFSDMANFVNAFIYYYQFNDIPSNNKVFDINGDDKIDFTDIVIFVAAYIEFNKD